MNNEKWGTCNSDICLKMFCGLKRFIKSEKSKMEELKCTYIFC